MEILTRHPFAGALLAILALSAATSWSQSPQGTLEVPAPDSTQSGIGAISGWHCSAGRIEISIDGGPLMLAGSHTARNDTGPRRTAPVAVQDKAA